MTGRNASRYINKSQWRTRCDNAVEARASDCVRVCGAESPSWSIGNIQLYVLIVFVGEALVGIREVFCHDDLVLFRPTNEQLILGYIYIQQIHGKMIDCCSIYPSMMMYKSG